MAPLDITQKKASENQVTVAQKQTPYFDALEKYIETGVIPFHVPGHRQGMGVHEKFKNFVKKHGLAADVSQVLGLDDIHQPTSVVEQAQELAAQAYGVEHSFFMINGSSSGVHAMLLATLNPGDKIILPRNCHRSVTGALILTGAIPVYIEPEYDYEMQVDHTVTPKALKKTIQQNKDAKAVLLLSPTYYGAACDIKKMVEIIHKYDLPALVDEAWGAHFHFHPDLPDSACDAGADIIINSTHKLVGSMAQASMVHTQGNRIDLGRLRSVIRLFLSTSPSCLLVASLDVARMNLAINGRELLDRTIKLANYAREQINKIPGLKAYGKELIGRSGVHQLDLTKLTVSAKELDITGYEIENILRYNYNIQFEMSDLFNCLALITIGTTEKDIEKIIEAFGDVKSWQRQHHNLSKVRLFYRRKEKQMELPDWPNQILTPREAFVRPFEKIRLRESTGRICGEVITPYPPGIPILRPGDEITEQIIDHLILEMEAGVHIQGPDDPTMETIRVVK
ncbi:MAG: aminotransferase class I/II-fold pyridoxal phosphate-dependent enzyme [Vulcanimicrobiota bacterium]